MSDDEPNRNPLSIPREAPLAAVQKRLLRFRELLVENGIQAGEPPLHYKDQDLPGRDWLPEPEWISGWTAFEIFQLQEEPYEWPPALARLCKVISDYAEEGETEPNFALATLPPSHPLLEEFPAGTRVWFRALYELLTVKNGEEIEGWENLVTEIYEWVGVWDNLRLRSRDTLEEALSPHWSVVRLSLPETKQNPVWTFPMALTWIATRDFRAMARMPVFCQPVNETEEAVADEGVWRYATKALGWLHTDISFVHCKCGALSDYRFESWRHCTCISVAWEELVRHMGGLASHIPELVFNLQEGWISMTWPEGADDIRFLRSEIMEKWPAVAPSSEALPTARPSIASVERECERWLLEEFAIDPEKKRSKSDFRSAAMARFGSGLSERGFNQRVWPKLAREHGRDSAGAKRKS